MKLRPGAIQKWLVPVLLEQVEPPLGFRQYQCLNLIGWNGRGTPRGLPRILSAVAKVTRAAEAPVAGDKPARSRRFTGRPVAIGAIAIAILVAAAGIALIWFRGSIASAAPSISVAASKAAPAQQSAALAHSVALDLSNLQTGPLSGLTINEPGEDPASRTDYRVEIVVTPGSSNIHADIALLNQATRQVVWTTGVDASAGQLVDLRQRTSAQLGAVLACLVHTPAMRPRPTSEVVNLYLAGCARLSDT
jgi:hypothetical protein